MVAAVQIKGLNEVVNFFVKLSPETQKDLKKTATRFMKLVQKSAKLRTPRFSGFLASSIKVKGKGKNKVILSVGAKYGPAMETGEGLPFYISRRKLSHWFGASRTRGSKLSKGRLPPKKGLVVVSHYKPFLQPALETGLNRLPNMINESVKKTIQRLEK